MTGAVPRCRLYLVSPPLIDPAAFRDRMAAALDAGDVACIQLRLKDLSRDEVRRACEILVPVAHSRGVAFILNDDPELAAETGCDGAHIGQKDMPYAEARRHVGPDRILGVTCHDSRHFAMEAAEKGADYVAFGAFYPTTTKPSHYRPKPELLHWWSEIMTVPCVAIGGIDATNCAPLVRAGADFIAVVRAVWEHPEGPAAGVRALNAAISAVSERG